MKILVAVDGSDASLHAATTAFTLAKNGLSTVAFIYVSLPFVSSSEAVAMFPDPTVQMQEAADTLLRRALSAVKGPDDTALLNRVGAPAEVIAEVAVQEGFDLVVVGHTGRGAVARVLIGSIADRLVHICEKPVLVVR